MFLLSVILSLKENSVLPGPRISNCNTALDFPKRPGGSVSEAVFLAAMPKRLPMTRQQGQQSILGEDRDWGSVGGRESGETTAAFCQSPAVVRESI